VNKLWNLPPITASIPEQDLQVRIPKGVLREGTAWRESATAFADFAGRGPASPGIVLERRGQHELVLKVEGAQEPYYMADLIRRPRICSKFSAQIDGEGWFAREIRSNIL